MTAVVGVEGVDADGVLASEVVINDRVGQRDELAMPAVRALDARLLADPGPPFIGACRAVAGLAARLALPADRVNIGAAPEQTSEQRDLLGGGKLRDFLFWGRCWGWRRLQAPLDPMLFQKGYQSRVFGAELGKRSGGGGRLHAFKA